MESRDFHAQPVSRTLCAQTSLTHIGVTGWQLWGSIPYHFVLGHSTWQSGRTACWQCVGAPSPAGQQQCWPRGRACDSLHEVLGSTLTGRAPIQPQCAGCTRSFESWKERLHVRCSVLVRSLRARCRAGEGVSRTFCTQTSLTYIGVAE